VWQFRLRTAISGLLYFTSKNQEVRLSIKLLTDSRQKISLAWTMLAELVRNNFISENSMDIVP